MCSAGNRRCINSKKIFVYVSSLFPTKMARTSIFALLFVIGSYQWQVNTLTVMLTPSTILPACPGDIVVINCYVSETTADTRITLRWQITSGPINTSINMIELSLSDLKNDTNRQEGGLEFHAKFTSYSPLSATLTTTADLALDGATVTCRSSSASSDPLVIRVTQTDHPKIQWLNVTERWFEADNLTVIIEWEANSDCLDFIISLASPTDTCSDYNNITTRNRSHTFSIFYNINYTVTVAAADSNGNNSDEISKTFSFIKCESPSMSHLENVNITGYVFPALENAQIFVSCLPGYNTSYRETTTIMSTCTSEGMWEPNLDLECQPRECNTCAAVTVRNGYPIRIVALGVGIPLILPCLCLFGTVTVVLSSLVVKRKRGSSKQEDKQSAEDSQNRENHTIEVVHASIAKCWLQPQMHKSSNNFCTHLLMQHWGIYSLLAQPDQAGSTRNSAIYAEIGPKAIIPPEGKKGKKEKKGAHVVMPDTNVQYAEVKKKPQSTAEQQEQRATDLDMNVVLNLDQLLLKLRSQVSPKWRQFGFAVKVPVETLNELTSYQEEQRLSEIAGYWMKQHQGRLIWREVARIMKEIDLNDLAEEMLNDSTGNAKENEATQHYHTVAELSSTDLSDEPAKTDTDDNNIAIQDT